MSSGAKSSVILGFAYRGAQGDYIEAAGLNQPLRLLCLRWCQVGDIAAPHAAQIDILDPFPLQNIQGKGHLFGDFVGDCTDLHLFASP